MTRFLASVMDCGEAEIVISAGADIVDLKDPRSGALGALPLETVAQALRMVAGRRPVSATLGDLPMEPQLACRQAAALSATGVDFIKIGLWQSPARDACIAALAQVAAAHALVGVLFADEAPEPGIVARLAAAGFSGVMVDTARKSGAALRHYMDDAALARFVAAAHEHRMFCGLAGSLSVADISALLELKPDYLGFRGALCNGGQRRGHIDSAAVARVRRAIPPEIAGAENPLAALAMGE